MAMLNFQLDKQDVFAIEIEFVTLEMQFLVNLMHPPCVIKIFYFKNKN